MKKHTAAAAVLAVLMLSSCGNTGGPDLPKEYKSYLDYTFDGSYSVSGDVEKTTDDDGYITKNWTVDYTDANGGEHTDKLKISYIRSAEKDFLKKESDWAVLNFVLKQESNTLKTELMPLIEAQFDDIQASEKGNYSGNGYELELSVIRLEGIFSEDEAVFGDLLDPVSGEKYSTCDLKSCASGSTMALHITVDADADKAAEIKTKLEAFTEAYKEYTGSPQNYCFELYAKDDTDDRKYYVCKILGKDASPDDFNAGTIYSKLGGSLGETAPAL